MGCSRTAVPQPLPPQIAGDTTVTLTSGSLAHTGDNILTVTLADAATGGASWERQHHRHARDAVPAPAGGEHDGTLAG